MKKIRLDFYRLNRDFEDTTPLTGQKVPIIIFTVIFLVLSKFLSIILLLKAKKSGMTFFRSFDYFMDSETCFKSIKNLTGMNFLIPSYQRGYRWTENEVSALLDDLYEYSQTKKCGGTKSKFYCLQPLVVKNCESKYEVIDGQQRLTTIYLILKYLEQYAKDALGITDYSLFSLNYETRKNCEVFFEKEEFKKESNANLDFMHISKAYKTIEEWFGTDTKSARKKNDIFNVLIDDDFNAQFIWYETADSENAYEVFKRLNSGKLSLTNSELVKALILNDEDKGDGFNQDDVAQEWENIENHLEDDNLWYFINANPESEKYESTRMDFLLEALLLRENVDLKDNYFIFSEFNEKIKNNGWKKIWENIKSVYRTMQTWYDNRLLYHCIGFLMNSKGTHVTTIGQLLKDYDENTKEDFLSLVKEYCRKTIMGENKKSDFSILSYGKDNNTIHNILLLFNLATTQNQISETSRYPFKRHFKAAKNQWSLEHIHAQNERQKNWSQDELSQLKSDIKAIANLADNEQKEILIEFANFINEENLKEEEIYKAMMAVFMGEKIELQKDSDGKIESVYSDFEKDDTLMNLALLQSDKNAAFNNKTFPEKRRILSSYENAERETQFVPICTRNVFFKHYSPEATNPLIWDREAGIGYVRSMIKVIGKFVEAEPFDSFDKKKAETFEYGLKSK